MSDLSSRIYKASERSLTDLASREESMVVDNGRVRQKRTLRHTELL